MAKYTFVHKFQRPFHIEADSLDEAHQLVSEHDPWGDPAERPELPEWYGVELVSIENDKTMSEGGK